MELLRQLWLRELYPPGLDGELGVCAQTGWQNCTSAGLGKSPELAQARLTSLDPVEARRALVLLASTLAMLLANLGRREEALTAVEEAVAIRRELVGLLPGLLPAVFASRYANSLFVKAKILSAFGRIAEAQAAGDEAAGVRGTE